MPIVDNEVEITIKIPAYLNQRLDQAAQALGEDKAVIAMVGAKRFIEVIEDAETELAKVFLKNLIEYEQYSPE